MDKEDAAHIYNGILLSHKRKEIHSFLETWMDLVSFVRTEVSQKEKSKYHILMHTYGIYRNGTDEPICREGIEMPM